MPVQHLPAGITKSLQQTDLKIPFRLYKNLQLKSFYKSANNKHKLFFPVETANREILGVLLFEISAQKNFGYAQKKVIEQASRVCASLIDGKNAFRDVDYVIKKLELLAHLIDQLAINPLKKSLSCQYDFVGEKTRQLLDAQFSCLWLLKKEEASFYAGYNRSGKLQLFKTLPLKNLRNNDSSIISPALQSQKIFIAPRSCFAKAAHANGEIPLNFLKSGPVKSAIACPFFDSKGNIDGMIVVYNKSVSHDISGRATAFTNSFDLPLLQIFSENVQTSFVKSHMLNKLKQHRLIIDSTPDPVIVSSKFGKITYMNPGAESMFGNMLGKSVTLVYYSDETNSNLERAREIKNKLRHSADGNISNHETILSNQKGKPVYASISVSTIKDEQGGFNGSIGIAKDLSKSRALLTIGQALLDLKSTNLLLLQVTEFGLQIPQSNRAYFKLYSKDENLLKFEALSSKIPGELCPEVGTPIDKGFTGHVFMHQKPYYTGDVHADPKIKWNAIFPAVRSKIIIPITYHDNETGNSCRLGVFSVDSAEKNAFSQADISYLETLANQAAVALYNANLLEAKNRLIQRLKATERVQKTTVSSQIDNEVVYESLLDAVTKYLDFQFAWISLIDKKKNTISCVHGRNVDGEFIRLANHSLDSKDIQAWVVRHGEQFYIDRYDERLDEYLYNEFNHDNYVRLITPILKEGEIIGTLEVGYSKNFRKEITEDEKKFIEHLSRQTGLALAHRELHNKLKDDIKVRLNLEKQLDALNEASIKLLNTTTEEEAIHHIFQGLKSVGFDKGMLSLVERDAQRIEGKYALGDNWKKILPHSKYRLTDKNICAAILRSKKAEFIANCGKDLRCDKNLVRRAQINSQYVIPLIAKGEPIGVLQIDLSDNKEIRHQNNEIVQEHMKVLHAFAAQSAIALRNIHGLLTIDRLETTIAETAHEFRNPLHNILTQIGGLRDHLQESYSGKEIDKYIQIIQEEVYRAKRQVDNSLSLTQKTRISDGCDFHKHSIFKIIMNCVDNYKLRALERGIRFAVRDNIRRLPKIEIDKTKIEQVLSNVIENAVKYSHYRQLVNIKGYEHSSHILVTISNRGLGIPPDEKEKIFQGFLRSKARDSRRYISGTGIGLKICKDFVEQHSGQIYVDSKPMSNNRHKIRDFQDYQTSVNILLPKAQKRSRK